jgi:hypothetical protein
MDDGKLAAFIGIQTEGLAEGEIVVVRKKVGPFQHATAISPKTEPRDRGAFARGDVFSNALGTMPIAGCASPLL